MWGRAKGARKGGGRCLRGALPENRERLYADGRFSSRRRGVLGEFGPTDYTVTGLLSFLCKSAYMYLSILGLMASSHISCDLTCGRPGWRHPVPHSA